MLEKKPIQNYKRYGMRIVIVLVVIIIIAVVIMYVLRDHVTVSGEYPGSVRTSSSVCTKTGTSYPYTEADGIEVSKENSIRIVGTFDSTSGSLTKIALDYSAYFMDKPAAVNGEAHMHAALGKKLAEDGLAYSELDNQFAIVDKKVILSFYAEADNINANNYLYLLLPYATSKKKLSLEGFSKHYEKIGYKCISTNQ